jgi:DNA-binding MarR family transcriptional regulator
VKDSPAAPDHRLARLFAIGFRSLVDGLHEQLAERGWDDVRPAFGFVLLAARDAPTSSTEVAGIMGVTKQAASKVLDAMIEAGYLERAPQAHDRRQRPVQLTARGRSLLDAVESIYDDLEGEWASVVGDDELERLRRTLTRVLTADGERALPPVRPGW